MKGRSDIRHAPAKERLEGKKKKSQTIIIVRVPGSFMQYCTWSFQLLRWVLLLSHFTKVHRDQIYCQGPKRNGTGREIQVYRARVSACNQDSHRERQDTHVYTRTRHFQTVFHWISAMWIFIRMVESFKSMFWKNKCSPGKVTAFYAWVSSTGERRKQQQKEPEIRPKATGINVTSPTAVGENTISTTYGISVRAFLNS